MTKLSKINWGGILRILVIILLLWVFGTSIFGKTINLILIGLLILYFAYSIYKSKPIQLYKNLKKDVEVATWGKPINEMSKEEIKNMKISGGFKNESVNKKGSKKPNE